MAVKTAAGTTTWIAVAGIATGTAIWKQKAEKHLRQLFKAAATKTAAVVAWSTLCPGHSYFCKNYKYCYKDRFGIKKISIG